MIGDIFLRIQTRGHENYNVSYFNDDHRINLVFINDNIDAMNIINKNVALQTAH